MRQVEPAHFRSWERTCLRRPSCCRRRRTPMSRFRTPTFPRPTRRLPSSSCRTRLLRSTSFRSTARCCWLLRSRAAICPRSAASLSPIPRLRGREKFLSAETRGLIRCPSGRRRADRRRGGCTDLGRGRAAGDEHRRHRDQQQTCQPRFALDRAAPTTAIVCARLSHVVSLLCSGINSLTRELSIVQTLPQLTWWLCPGILPFCCPHTWVAPLILWFDFRRRSRPCTTR